MAIKSSFFNSIDHDRVYSAEDFGMIYDGMISDGVFKGYFSTFSMSWADSDIEKKMRVGIQPGKAWFNQTWTVSDNAIYLDVESTPGSYERIDLIVIEVNKTPSVRENSIKIVKGKPAAKAAYPELINNESVHQYILGVIYMPGYTTYDGTYTDNVLGPSQRELINVIGAKDIVGAAPFAEVRYVNEEVDLISRGTYFRKVFKSDNIGNLMIPHLSPGGIGSPLSYILKAELPSNYEIVDVIMSRAWPLKVWAPMYMPYWIQYVDEKTNKKNVQLYLYSSAGVDQEYSCDFTVIYTKGEAG